MSVRKRRYGPFLRLLAILAGGWLPSWPIQPHQQAKIEVFA
jgi:hypothetical protein